MSKATPPTYSLDHLLSDGRLERLFSRQDRKCALQLWILQLKSASNVEPRLVYGRLLPYSFSNDQWSGTDDDHFEVVGGVQAQIARLNLYLKSSKTEELLRLLCAGKNLQDVSVSLQLSFAAKLAVRFGQVTVGSPLLFRPVAYLLNRDSHVRDTLLSPHGGADALSASIQRRDKAALAQLDGDFDADLASFIVRRMDEDTGLQFASRDLQRLGELELLVFPTLDDQERNLLSAQWGATRTEFIVQLDASQLTHYDVFSVRLNITNDHQLMMSSLAAASAISGTLHECKFQLPPTLYPIACGAEVEIYGSKTGTAGPAILCCQWRIGFVRQIMINGKVQEHGGGSLRLDWLERVTKRKSARERLKAAQTIRQDKGFQTQVGDWQADPWVPANRALRSLFERLHPPASDGRFFERLSDGDGLGRLELVEWFKQQLINQRGGEVLVFDPYFEDAGIGLVAQNAGGASKYRIFVCLEEPTKKSFWDKLLRVFAPLRLLIDYIRATVLGKDTKREVRRTSRIDNLLAACDRLTPIMRGIDLKVFAFQPKAFHDRYILFIGAEGLPASGFHLSNSLQRANESYPLLVTPIPADTLLKVISYARRLLIEAFAHVPPAGSGANKIEMIFDSASKQQPKRKYHEPLNFLADPLVGRVLADWTGEPSLRGLGHDALRKRMEALGFLTNNVLAIDQFPGLDNCIATHSSGFAAFAPYWDVLGDVLANTHSGDRLPLVQRLGDRGFLDFLGKYLKRAFSRTQSRQIDTLLTALSPRYFKDSFETYLASNYRHDSFFQPTKYPALLWAEFYAVNILWRWAPTGLISLAEQEAASVPEEVTPADAVRVSLLGQIASEMALCTQFGASDAQRDGLMSSRNGFFKWLGLGVLELQLEMANGAANVIRNIQLLSNDDRIRVLAWLTKHCAGNPTRATSFQALVKAIHGLWSGRASKKHLELLVNSCRGPLQNLGYQEPWLFEEVVYPLQASSIASADDICDIWIKDLASTIESDRATHGGTFSRAVEGRQTEVAAFLFANSQLPQQQAALVSLQRIVKHCANDVRQPLASTLNWAKWDASMGAALRILAFARHASHRLNKPCPIQTDLDQLASEARDISLFRPISEWRRHGANPGAIVKFIEEVGKV